MSEPAKEVFAAIGLTLSVVAFAVVYVAAAVIVKGYVLSVLWSWFVMPTFALPTLSVPLAIGLTMVVAVVLPRPTIPTPAEEKKKSGWRKFYEALVFVFGPLLALPMGQIILWWMGQ